MKSAILSVALLLLLNLDFMTSHGVSDCLLPKVTGLCRARFPRFYFNEAKGRCEGFTFGGCGGNGNNFKTLKECKQTCICPLPPQTGHCRGYFPRYHFDEASGQCEKFIYGGCGGNENNFKTLKECQQTCGAK